MDGPRHVRVGTLIRRQRRERGLSLVRLARRVGCAKSYLSAIESGAKGPPGDALLERLERALGLPVGELVEAAGWERTPERVRRGVERLRADHKRLELLRSLAASGGLDEAYRAGRLGAMLGLDDAGMEPVSLPLEVPVINNVAAGYPTDFSDLGYPARVADEYVRAPDIRDPDAFAARVVGDSMEPEYRAGDIVVFSPAREVVSGCDCFVRLEPDHETTFKRVYFEIMQDGTQLIRMQPINSKYPPRTLEREQVAGLYRAASVIRWLEGEATERRGDEATEGGGGYGE